MADNYESHNVAMFAIDDCVDFHSYPIPISDRIKIRYNERMEKYGKGLLNPGEN
jgi:hypothetical protein